MALREAVREMHGRHVAIVCGGGNNGGDGYALARLLHNDGRHVVVFAAKPLAKLDGDAKVNAAICDKLGVDVRPAEAKAIERFTCDVIVDALLGTGLTKPPRDEVAKLIDAMNANPAPTLAVDVPSGLDCDTGKPLGESCVEAERTVTFAAPKVGFDNGDEYVGEVTIGDIGAPREAIERARRVR